MTPLSIRREPDSAAPSVRRFAEGRAGNLERQRARNLRALQAERQARCLWSAARHGEPVQLFVKDGEDTPFGACALCAPIVLERRGYRPFDGPGAAA